VVSLIGSIVDSADAAVLALSAVAASLSAMVLLLFVAFTVSLPVGAPAGGCGASTDGTGALALVSVATERPNPLRIACTTFLSNR
jgi:hypothetical protein